MLKFHGLYLQMISELPNDQSIYEQALNAASFDALRKASLTLADSSIFNLVKGISSEEIAVSVNSHLDQDIKRLVEEHCSILPESNATYIDRIDELALTLFARLNKLVNSEQASILRPSMYISLYSQTQQENYPPSGLSLESWQVMSIKIQNIISEVVDIFFQFNIVRNPIILEMIENEKKYYGVTNKALINLSNPIWIYRDLKPKFDEFFGRDNGVGVVTGKLKEIYEKHLIGENNTWKLSEQERKEAYTFFYILSGVINRLPKIIGNNERYRRDIATVTMTSSINNVVNAIRDSMVHDTPPMIQTSGVEREINFVDDFVRGESKATGKKGLTGTPTDIEP